MGVQVQHSLVSGHRRTLFFYSLAETGCGGGSATTGALRLNCQDTAGVPSTAEFCCTQSYGKVFNSV